MMVDLAEVVLYALWVQAQARDEQLVLGEAAVGAALTEYDGFGRTVHLEPVKGAGDKCVRVTFT